LNLSAWGEPLGWHKLFGHSFPETVPHFCVSVQGFTPRWVNPSDREYRASPHTK
jgi:hypothetical protein